MLTVAGNTRSASCASLQLVIGIETDPAAASGGATRLRAKAAAITKGVRSMGWLTVDQKLAL
jgi:hypothetical protein